MIHFSFVIVVIIILLLVVTDNFYCAKLNG